MKRLIVVLIAVAMLLSFAACGEKPAANEPAESPSESGNAGGESAAPGEDSPAPSDAEPYEIGINTWYAGVYALDVCVNNTDRVLAVTGDKSIVYNDEGNAEKIITDLENMVSVGVDGILWLGMFDTNFVTGPQIPNDAKTYFAFYDKIPSDPDLVQSIREMEYFAGAVGSGNYAAGVGAATQALADGCTAALLAAAEVGDPSTDARVQGFVDTFEAGGGTISSVSRVSTGEANGPLQAIENMMGAYPNADAIYCTGQDFTLAALSAVDKSGAVGKVSVYGTDLNPDLLEYLKDGTLAACSGAHWTESIFSTIMLINALDGKVMVDEDGLPGVLNDENGVGFIAVSSKYADLYQRFFIDDNPYEDDEIKNLLYRFNPDVTLEDIKEAISNYGIEERLIAKYEAGKVTAEELAEVGIDVTN